MKKLLAYNLSVGIYLLPVAYLALNSTIVIMLMLTFCFFFYGCVFLDTIQDFLWNLEWYPIVYSA